MKAELTAIIEEAEEGGYWAICPEIPGANGQGETLEEVKQDLGEAVKLILEDRLADVRRGLPSEAIEAVVAILHETHRFAQAPTTVRMLSEA